MANEALRPGGEDSAGRRREPEPKPFDNTIIALDVDGVLIKPVAYRQATRSTISYFADQLGVDAGDYMLDDRNSAPGRNMSHFEAEGVHDPWDVSAIVVSLMKLNKAGIPVTNDNALDALRSPQGHPPEIVLEWIRNRYPQIDSEVMSDITRTLSATRDPFNNEVTSIFQEYVLGKDTFEEAYGMQSRTGAEESLIKTKDVSLINDRGRRIIDEISKNGGMVIIYTARPGTPPFDVERSDVDGYAPEAELAVDKSKVKATGIVSMGSMEWLSRVTGASVESLTKPNPTQALATILAALRGRVDAEVLIDAFNWGQASVIPEEVRPFIGDDKKQIDIAVVEDSPGGLRAFVNARKMLEEQGIRVGLTGIGVHGDSFEKHMAFDRLAREEGIDIMDTNLNIEEGVRRYFYRVQSLFQNRRSVNNIV